MFAVNSSSAQGVEFLLGLIQVLKSPKDAEALLKDLSGQITEVTAARDESLAKFTAAVELEKKLESKAAELDKLEAKLGQREEKLEAKEAAAAKAKKEFDAEVEAFKADNAAKAKGFNEAAADAEAYGKSLDTLAASLNARDEALAAKEAEVAALKDELESKLAALKSIAG